jgi:hypothetical protein
MSTSINTTHDSSRQRAAGRFKSAVENARQEGRGGAGAPGLATLLSSALAAAVMVVAFQVMDSVAEGHLLVLWMVLWVSAFAALVLFAGAARMASRSRAGATAGRPLRAIQGVDTRVRHDLQTAADRSASDAETYREVVRPQLRTMSARAKRLARFS